MAIHVLQPGCSIEHERDALGNTLVTVTIPPGQSGQGVYTSTALALSDDALEAIALAARPGSQIEVNVNGLSLEGIAMTLVV